MEMGRCYPVCNKCSHQKQFIILFIGANICRLRLLESGTRMNHFDVSIMNVSHHNLIWRYFFLVEEKKLLMILLRSIKCEFVRNAFPSLNHRFVWAYNNTTKIHMQMRMYVVLCCVVLCVCLVCYLLLVHLSTRLICFHQRCEWSL